MKKPGVVLGDRRLNGLLRRAHAELPIDLGDGENLRKSTAGRKAARRRRLPPAPVDKAAEQKAALAYEREQKHRERERAREEVSRQKERERRQQAVDKAQAALDKAAREHDAKAGAIEAERAAAKKRSQ
jgi:hypothetical protein